MSAATNANTGEIYDATGVTTSIFPAANDISDLAGVTCTGAAAPYAECTASGLLTNRNIIWSDKSADTHTYPTVTSTAVPYVSSANGSYDWTNGYKLGATDLSSSILTY